MAKLKERSMYEEDEDFPNDEEDARNPNQSNNLLFFNLSFPNELLRKHLETDCHINPPNEYR